VTPSLPEVHASHCDPANLKPPALALSRAPGPPDSECFTEVCLSQTGRGVVSAVPGHFNVTELSSDIMMTRMMH
jgi:hypothetical protein